MDQSFKLEPGNEQGKGEKASHSAASSPASPSFSPIRPKRSPVRTAAAVAALVLGLLGTLSLLFFSFSYMTCPRLSDLVTPLMFGALVLLLSAFGRWKARAPGVRSMAVIGLVLGIVICTNGTTQYLSELHKWCN